MNIKHAVNDMKNANTLQHFVKYFMEKHATIIDAADKKAKGLQKGSRTRGSIQEKT